MAKKNTGKQSSTGRSGNASATSSRSQGPMDVGLLEQITRLMRDNDLNTVDVRDGDKRVILKRGVLAAPSGSSGGYAMISHHPGSSNAGLPQGAGSGSGGASSSVPAVTDVDAGLVAIKSPMVGTFYLSSSPEAKAFVSVGSTVDEDSDVCIIEAMKVFNNIKAEMNGTIQKILIANGETVEFGQPLFLVKPS